MFKIISREKLNEKLERGDNFTLVETLPRTAFEHIHLPGAINIPPDRLIELAPVVLPDKQAEIVVYCSKPS